MEQVRQRIEEIKQLQRKRMQGSAQTTTEPGAAHDRQQYSVALGGVAVGLMIAAVIWLTKPLAMEDNTHSIRPAATEAISPDEIRTTHENIARLNQRMELLADTISSMDARFKRILVLADAMEEVNNTGASAPQRSTTDPVAEAAGIDEDSSDTASMDNTPLETEQAFVPTHTVNARINLRPSTSVHTKPVAVLDIGTEVEYISETDGWYYVNTRLHGKGWCSSDYLSALTTR